MQKYDWNKNRVEQAVKNNTCYIDVLRELNIPTQGNNQKTLKRKIEEFNIDTSHFTYISKTKGNKQYVKAEEYLKEGTHVKTFRLKEKLFKEHLKEQKCEICGITEWQNKPIVLQLHHINGNPTDNRLENLQILCPNCHSQTDNFCGSANKTEKPKYYCKDCGKEIKTNAAYCPKCSAKHNRKVNWDVEIENIKQLIQKGWSNVAIGQKYTVSDTTIRKLRKKYNI